MLVRGGVEPFVFVGEVEGEVGVEVSVVLHRTEFEDGFGAVESPPCSGDLQAVADEVPACALYRAGGDRKARRSTSP